MKFSPVNELLEYLDSHNQKKQDCHRPSQSSAVFNNEVFGKCNRAQAYEWMEVPPTNAPTPTAKLKMAMGNAIHTAVAIWYAKIAEKKGWGAASEIKVEQRVEGLAYPIRGHFDNILTVDGERIGVELKTTYGRGMTSDDGVQKKGPKKEHVIQAQLYMFLTGIKKWWLVPLARDTGFHMEFEIDYDQKIVDSVVERWKELEAFLVDKKIPPRDYHSYVKNGVRVNEVQVAGLKKKSEWQCNYCQYSSHCWSGEKDNYLEEVKNHAGTK